MHGIEFTVSATLLNADLVFAVGRHPGSASATSSPDLYDRPGRCLRLTCSVLAQFGIDALASFTRRDSRFHSPRHRAGPHYCLREIMTPRFGPI